MRKLKQKIFELLKMEDEETALTELLTIPMKQSVNPLFSFIQNTNEHIKWRAIRAMGKVVANMAAHNTESARIIMRRLMWSLNDESGGIGWGAPEAMGEIMAQDETLAREYHHMLLSYVDEKGNFLEYEPLRKGAVWAIKRVCEARPGIIKCGSEPVCIPFL